MSTRVWSRIDDIFDSDGQQIAEIANNARSEMLFNEDELIVKVDNRALYDGRWTKCVDQLLLGEDWGYVATSQLDIAADGFDFLKPFNNYVHDRIEYAGKGKCFFSKDPNKPIDGFRLGSRNSAKYARCYYKKQELMVSGKMYIEDYWKAQGIEKTDGMQRLEISMKGTEIRRYFGGGEAVNEATGEIVEIISERDPAFLQRLREPKSRADLYLSAAAKFIRFRERKPGARAREKRSLLKWDFSRIGPEVMAVERAPRIADIGLNFIKSGIKFNYLCGLANGGRQYLSIAQQQVAAFGLQEWYAVKQAEWRASYRKFIAEGGLTAKQLFDGVRLTDHSSGIILDDVD